MNVRYVVTEGPASGALAGAVSELERFGALRLHELNGWSDRVVDAPLGEAIPTLSVYEDERVVFAPEGARSVVIRRATGPGWHAYADGVEVPIEEERVYDSPRLRLMRLELPAGVREVELVYRGFRAPFVLGWLLTLLGLAAVVLLAGGWEMLPAERRDALITVASRFGSGAWARAPERVRALLSAHWPALACAAPLVGLGLVIALGARGTHLPRTPHEARIERGDGSVLPCSGGGARHVCAGTTVERTQVAVDGVYHSCLSAWPVREGALVLAWQGVPMSGSLRIGAGVDDQAFLRTGEPIEVTVRLDEEAPEVLRVPLSHEWVTLDVPLARSGPHDLRLEVRSRETSRRWLCLDAVAR
jgi:hypothetical protein